MTLKVSITGGGPKDGDRNCAIVPNIHIKARHITKLFVLKGNYGGHPN